MAVPARGCAGRFSTCKDTLSSIERCRKPVIAEIHGACIVAHDLITCCDMRYAAAERISGEGDRRGYDRGRWYASAPAKAGARRDRA